jgi:hypothetical protein
MTEKMSADFQRDEGRGTRDEKNWKGEIPAEPKLIGKSAGRQIGKSERQRIANKVFAE